MGCALSTGISETKKEQKSAGEMSSGVSANQIEQVKREEEESAATGENSNLHLNATDQHFSIRTVDLAVVDVDIGSYSSLSEEGGGVFMDQERLQEGNSDGGQQEEEEGLGEEEMEPLPLLPTFGRNNNSNHHAMNAAMHLWFHRHVFEEMEDNNDKDCSSLSYTKIPFSSTAKTVPYIESLVH